MFDRSIHQCSRLCMTENRREQNKILSWYTSDVRKGLNDHEVLMLLERWGSGVHLQAYAWATLTQAAQDVTVEWLLSDLWQEVSKHNNLPILLVLMSKIKVDGWISKPSFDH